MSDPNNPGPAPAPQSPAPAAPAPKPGDKPEPKKVELTEDELQARMTAAVEADRQKREKADAKEKADREAEEAKKRGEFEKVAEQEKARADAAEAKLRRRELQDAVRAHLKKDHAGYEDNDVDVLAHVMANLAPDADEAITKRVIGEQARAFVERTPKAKANVPPPSSRDRIEPNQPVPPKKTNGHMNRMAATGPAMNF